MENKRDSIKILVKNPMTEKAVGVWISCIFEKIFKPKGFSSIGLTSFDGTIPPAISPSNG
ncbi:MAG: hypothetical protein HC831_23485 [Chloroflexia bacterium]|nr:hypothetical protein [Chloroflexia bacterium]